MKHDGWLKWRDNLLGTVGNRLGKLEATVRAGLVLTIAATLTLATTGRLLVLGAQVDGADAGVVDELWSLSGLVAMMHLYVQPGMLRELEFARVAPELRASFVASSDLSFGTFATVFYLLAVLFVWWLLYSHGGPVRSSGALYAGGAVVLAKLACLRLQGVLPLRRV